MRSHATRHLVAVVVLVSGVVLAPLVREARPGEATYDVDLSAIPMEIDGLEGRELPKDEGVQAYLEADVMRTIAYGQSAEAVTVSIIYGGSWRTVHSPAQCYPAAGWQVVWERDSIVPIEQDLPHPKPVLGHLMRVERDEHAQLVLFIFAHKGGTAVDYTEHAWAVQTGPRGAGGLSLMLSTPADTGEDQARERLVDIASKVYPHAVAFWYEDWEPTGGRKRLSNQESM